jgi:hypothetical protein
MRLSLKAEIYSRKLIFTQGVFFRKSANTISIRKADEPSWNSESGVPCRMISPADNTPIAKRDEPAVRAILKHLKLWE